MVVNLATSYALQDALKNNFD